MKLLVTGGCGFIGSNFIRHILKKYPDYSIINIDKLTYAGNKDNLKDIESNQKYQFVHGDICDKKLVESLMPKVDAVVNFAAETHVDRSIIDASPFIRTDILGMYSILEAAKKAKIKRFIHISTDEVYGSTLKGHFKESDPLQPNNPYSASKAAAELLARSYFVTHKLPILITRSANNFGPNHHPEKLIPRFITYLLDNRKVPLHGSGTAKRDWLYVLDNCEAIDLILHKGDVGEIYNIGSDNEKTNIEITKLLLNQLGKDESFIERVADRPGQDMRYSLDCSKINRLGWKPRYEFMAALKDTVNWYKNNREWWEKINRLVIVGARIAGQAGAVLTAVRLANEYEIAGFLDNTLQGTTIDGLPVVGGTDPLPNHIKAEAACIAIGNNIERAKMTHKLKQKGIRIINVIHPSASIAEDAFLGEGIYIGPGTIIGSRVKIGHNVIIGSGVVIEHDSIIEDNVHIAPGVNIDTRVRIKEGSYIGIGTKIIPDITIGKNAVIGAGVVVTEDVGSSQNIPEKYTGETFYSWTK